MHPLFNRLDRLVAYLGLCQALGASVAVFLALQDFGWLRSFAFVLPLAFLYAAVCLSAWYVCRAVPLTASGIPRALVASGISALLAGSLLIGAARAWIAVLGQTPGFAQAGLRFRSLMPLLFAAGVLLFLLSLAVHYAFLAFETAREAEHRRLQLEVLAREAELRALRAQIDPHFLYNSLNSISALTGRDPAGARRMCLLLGEFLRNTLNLSALQRIPLADELALVDRFLDIEQVRFGSRLQVTRAIDDGGAQLPGAAADSAAAHRECRRPWHRRAAGGRRHHAVGRAARRAPVDRHREPSRSGSVARVRRVASDWTMSAAGSRPPSGPPHDSRRAATRPGFASTSICRASSGIEATADRSLPAETRGDNVDER